MTDSPKARLQALLRARIDAPATRWLDEAMSSTSSDELCRAYTAAPKHVGRAPIGAREYDGWNADDAARCVLLLGAAERLEPQAFAAAAVECFERGDSREQQSWLRALSLMPEPERFRETAVDACRTNIVPLFESIACENPYPARFFPELSFNQLVLKAMFNNIALARIVGLRDRSNAELTRMAADYAAERRAAGRSVPPDIALAMQCPIHEELSR
jgi:hypothetical protein